MKSRRLSATIPYFAGYCKGDVSSRSSVRAVGQNSRCLTKRAFERGVVKAKRVAPKAKGVAPKVKGVAPKVKGVAPKVKGVAPKVKGVAPRTIAGRIPCDGVVVHSPVPVPRVPLSPVPVSYLSSLDKFEVSCWVGWDYSSLGTTILDDLEEARDAIRNDELGRDVNERPFDLGDGISFNLGRFGAGKYPFVLKSADITILLSRHPADSKFPNCRLEVGSMSCWSPGWKHVWEKFLALLHSWGGTLFRHNPRRVDFAVDLLECDFSQTGFIESSRWISRGAKKIHTVEEDYIPSYKSFGKGDLMMRCYDKTMELDADSVKAEFFRGLWSDHLGYVPKSVSRVEFQICRNIFRELEIHTVDDLERNLNSIWLYCVGSQNDGWSRFCSSAISRESRLSKNYDSCKIDPLWDYVRAARFGSSPPVKLVRVHRSKPRFDWERARSRIAGIMLTVWAAWGINPYDYSTQDNRAFSFVYDSILGFRQSPDYSRKYKVKQNSYYVFGECSAPEAEEIIPHLMRQASEYDAQYKEV